MQIRYLERAIREDALARQRMAFVSGPRQVGKTTLGRALLEDHVNYRSWDDQSFRLAWIRDPVQSLQDRGPGPVVLDELHKDPHWKDRLKGLFDVSSGRIPLVVTGSARLDVYRRGGDSLLGRYLPYRLHPLSVGERPEPPSPDDLAIGEAPPTFAWEAMVQLGGFPEPLLDGEERHARRWSRLRTERLVSEDIRDIREVRDLGQLRLLSDLLPERVGSLLSHASLANLLRASPSTIHQWIDVFSELYHCFLIRPWSRKISRAITATPKLYLYDPVPVQSLPLRKENLTALHLLKACHYWTDVAFGEFSLWFLRTRDGAEVDFLVTRDQRPWMLVECKSGRTTPSPALCRFAEELQPTHCFQLVDNPDHDRFHPATGVRVIGYERMLASLV